MKALAHLYPERYGTLEQQAEAVRRAIYAHCVFRDTEQKPYFGWSVNLKGQHNVYDEPPGSLQLLPYYGFCAPDDEIWGNTVAMIRAPSYAYSFADAPIAEIGCAHAPYPWILSLCNSLLFDFHSTRFRLYNAFQDLISHNTHLTCCIFLLNKLHRYFKTPVKIFLLKI